MDTCASGPLLRTACPSSLRGDLKGKLPFCFNNIMTQTMHQENVILLFLYLFCLIQK